MECSITANVLQLNEGTNSVGIVRWWVLLLDVYYCVPYKI